MTVALAANTQVGQRSRAAVLVTLLAIVSPLLGCGEQGSQGDHEGQKPDAVQQATQTVENLLELARAGDWQNYVDRYYGESHKFRSDADRDKLVQRFENQWGAKVVESLARVVHVTPVIEGDKALFKVEEDVLFVLYRASDGGWKFHL